MNKSFFVTDFDFSHLKYQNVHSAGPDIYFSRPCVGYVKKGYAKFLYNGNTFYAREGDLIYIAFETRYSSIWYGSPDIEWYSISFDFSSKYSFYDYRFQIVKNYPPETFEKISRHSDASPMLALSALYELLYDLYNKMEITKDTRPHSLIDPAVKYIEQNYNKPLSIDDLASLCHISKSSLFKQFKITTGVTPIEYKHNFMIQYAVELLSNTNLSIEEISTKAGFTSSNYFRKIFTKLTDKTPKELRKRKP